MLIAKWRVRPQWKATRSFASLCLLLLFLWLLPGKYMKIVLTLDKRHKRHKVKRALGASFCLPFPSYLPCFPSFYLPSSAASAVIDATINLTSCSRRQLRNSQPLGGHLTTLITFSRSQFAQLLEWEITHSRSQSDLARHKGCSSFFCLCPSTISFVAAVCRQHAATSCHWTAKSGGIGLYNRRRILQQQRSFSVANNDNWVSSSSATSMRTMGCPGSVSGQLTGCAVHTPSVFLPFSFSFSPSLSCFFIA